MLRPSYRIALAHPFPICLLTAVLPSLLLGSPLLITRSKNRRDSSKYFWRNAGHMIPASVFIMVNVAWPGLCFFFPAFRLAGSDGHMIPASIFASDDVRAGSNNWLFSRPARWNR